MNRTLRIILLVWVVVMAISVLVFGRTRLDWGKPIPAPSAQPFLFSDDFEKGSQTSDLLPKDRSRWHSGQLIPLENSVELTTKRAHSGQQAVRCQASGTTGGVTSKADLQLEGLRFVKGDHVWSQFWLYLGEAGDWGSVFLWDLETSQKWKSPGRRLYLTSGNRLASDLGKWTGAATVRQPLAPPIQLPANQWVRLRLHLFLSEKRDGLVEAWMDDTKVLSAPCQTLPTAQTIYDRWQIGQTANGSNRPHVLYIDDVVLSNRPLP